MFAPPSTRARHRASRYLFSFLLVSSFCAGLVNAQDDSNLYYRRTHGGALPLPGENANDHSSEAGIAQSDTTTQKAVVMAAVLSNGVDPANLGKGDWIWQLSSCRTALGVSTDNAVLDYEKSKGMQWVTVKCGDGSDYTSWSQFSSALVSHAHSIGLKIFGWAYAYGSNVSGEIAVANHALSLGADGFIIDAETEYETLANNSTAAAQYCQGIRASYPNTFLAHAPYPIISSHSGFPYITFGKYCDAVMPQAYWADIGGTNYMTTMVTRMDTEWRNWQNGLSTANKDAIKPIVPIGQGYNSVNGNVTSAHITTWVNALKSDSNPATAGGYKGVSFWSCQHHSVAPEKWTGIAGATIGDTTPVISQQPLNRSVDKGSNAVFTVIASGTAPLKYQWKLNGANLSGATNSAYTVSNAQSANAGNYSVFITNSLGTATSSSAKLVVNLPQILQLAFSDNFDTNSAALWNLFQGSANNVSDYTANWAFDYSTTKYTFNGVTNTIPAAPNSSGTSKGLKVTVNKNDAVAAQSGVSLYPKSQNFGSNYTLKFDMWINYNGPAGGGTGSTEYMTCGLNHTGTRVNWATNNATSSDGLWFAVDGEGGSGESDYRAYLGTGGQPTELSFNASGLSANGAQSDNVADDFYQSLFPSSIYETEGVPGKHWVQCELSQFNGIVTWRMNNVVVAQRTNTSSYTSGNIMIGYMDVYSSIASPAADNFILFDNVRVYTVATPPTLVASSTNRIVNVGANTSFNVGVAGSSPLSLQWKFNNSSILNATNASLALTNIQPSQAGSYSVIVSNIAGVTNATATLTVTQMQFSSASVSYTNGLFNIDINGAPGAGYLVETSTNLSQWTPLGTFTNSNGAIHFSDPAGTNSPDRFYRVSAPQ